MNLDIIEFELKKEHILLLQRAYIGWFDCEAGAPYINCKRPYGNGYVEGDVAEILGWKQATEEGLSRQQENDAMKWHYETEIALQIILKTKSFKPGVYVRTEKYDTTSWIRKNN
jgi:hypothetical protein